MAKTVELRIKRQAGPSVKHDLRQAPAQWETFVVPHYEKMNVISCLTEIQLNPVTKDGKATTPVSWECSCLEEVCGSCTMNINGTPQQACSALVDQLEQPIVLEPLVKFPLIRDLIVDRQKLFDNLLRVKAWVAIDGTYPLGEGPIMAERDRAIAYELSRCMTCACCLEACPQVNARSPFMGAAVISLVRLFNMHPTGGMHKEARLEALMAPGGVSDCGNAQNCVEVCPKEIPLTTSIADMARAVTFHALKQFLMR
jgi:succinate dehydrogenase / fumarate reductase iron-sulfur subunit